MNTAFLSGVFSLSVAWLISAPAHLHASLEYLRPGPCQEQYFNMDGNPCGDFFYITTALEENDTSNDDALNELENNFQYGSQRSKLLWTYTIPIPASVLKHLRPFPLGPPVSPVPSVS